MRASLRRWQRLISAQESLPDIGFGSRRRICLSQCGEQDYARYSSWSDNGKTHVARARNVAGSAGWSPERPSAAAQTLTAVCSKSPLIVSRQLCKAVPACPTGRARIVWPGRARDKAAERRERAT